MYHANVLSLREYSEYVRTPQAHRDLLTWTGVHAISLDDPLGHLRPQESHAAARNDVISKLNQEQRQQQSKGKRKSQTDEGAPTTTSSSSSWGWMELLELEPLGGATAVGPRLVGLELEPELGAMELVEPSLNPFANSFA